MGNNTTKNTQFGFVENMFINLYTKDNPILFTDDLCYFLFTNIIDNHRPLIATGKIVQDKFTDGMNKSYIIELIEIYETTEVLEKYVYNGASLALYQFKDNFLTKSAKVHFINPSNQQYIFKHNVFKIESFFVRDSFDKIVALRNEYIKIIKRDLINQVSDIDDVLRQYENLEKDDTD